MRWVGSNHIVIMTLNGYRYYDFVKDEDIAERLVRLYCRLLELGIYAGGGIEATAVADDGSVAAVRISVGRMITDTTSLTVFGEMSSAIDVIDTLLNKEWKIARFEGESPVITPQPRDDTVLFRLPSCRCKSEVDITKAVELYFKIVRGAKLKSYTSINGYHIYTRYGPFTNAAVIIVAERPAEKIEPVKSAVMRGVNGVHIYYKKSYHAFSDVSVAVLRSKEFKITASLPVTSTTLIKMSREAYKKKSTKRKATDIHRCTRLQENRENQRHN